MKRELSKKVAKKTTVKALVNKQAKIVSLQNKIKNLDPESDKAIKLRRKVRALRDSDKVGVRTKKIAELAAKKKASEEIKKNAPKLKRKLQQNTVKALLDLPKKFSMAGVEKRVQKPRKIIPVAFKARVLKR